MSYRAILLVLLLLAYVPCASAAQKPFDFAFPELMDVFCRLLQPGDIPAAMSTLAPVSARTFEENIFHHQSWNIRLKAFTLEYDISQEFETDGTVLNEDYLFEARVEQKGANPLFSDLRQARGWLQELGKVTLDSTDQLEVTARPFPGEEKLAPLWWRIRIFCGSGEDKSCRMLRFFWNEQTEDHNKAFCRP